MRGPRQPVVVAAGTVRRHGRRQPLYLGYRWLDPWEGEQRGAWVLTTDGRADPGGPGRCPGEVARWLDPGAPKLEIVPGWEPERSQLIQLAGQLIADEQVRAVAKKRSVEVGFERAVRAVKDSEELVDGAPVWALRQRAQDQLREDSLRLVLWRVRRDGDDALTTVVEGLVATWRSPIAGLIPSARALADSSPRGGTSPKG